MRGCHLDAGLEAVLCYLGGGLVDAGDLLGGSWDFEADDSWAYDLCEACVEKAKSKGSGQKPCQGICFSGNYA